MQKSPLALALAANVRHLMDDRGLTQESLGKASGVSKSAIGYLLAYKDSSSRHASLDTIEALATALRVDPLSLIAVNPSSVARPLQVVGERRAPYELNRGTEGGLDTTTLQHILEQMEMIDEGTPAERAAVIAAAYAAVMDGGKRPAKAGILKMLRSA